MAFDWVTWSIWALGMIILIVWIYVPTKEFMQLLRDRKKRSEGKS
jgi:hypothetical protein